MPWETTNVIEARIRLVMAYLARAATMTKLCLLHRVSRKSGYKWVNEYRQHGLSGLGNRPRTPKSGKHWTGSAARDLIVQMRREHRSWSAAKIVARLQQLHPRRRFPSPTTAHKILRQAKLITPPRQRSRWREQGGRSVEVTRANALWTIDFKGQFRTRDGRWCYPLTVVDACSRYVLACVALASPTFEATWAEFEKLFRQYGLPDAIHSDNGEPFASRSVGGLSRLAVRFIRLGIRVQRSRPGHPQDNGSHERMHRTLKEEATRPPAANLAEQQIRFDRFRKEFNEERPHEAHGQLQPRRFYRPSKKAYRADPPHIEYPESFVVRRVCSRGNIKWKASLIFVSEVLVGERVGLSREDGSWHIYFSSILLGRLDERRAKVMQVKQTKRIEA